MPNLTLQPRKQPYCGVDAGLDSTHYMQCSQPDMQSSPLRNWEDIVKQEQVDVPSAKNTFFQSTSLVVNFPPYLHHKN